MNKKNIKGPILVLNETHYACGAVDVFVSRVTEKAIVVVCNDVAEVLYRRNDGYPKGRDRSGLSSIGTPMLTNLNLLEDWLSENGTPKNGTFVYDSGFRISVNSRHEVVRPEVKDAWLAVVQDSKWNPTYKMLQHLGYKFKDLRLRTDK